MKTLIIIVSMVAIAAAYRKGRRSVSSSLENFPPYQRPVWHPSHTYEQHRSFRELSPKTQQYTPYRQRSNRQDISPRPEQSPFRDQPYQDYPPHRYRPYYETDPSFKNVSDFLGPSSYFADGSSYRYHQERDQTPYKGKQPSYHYQDDRQSFSDDYRFPDQYDKPINHYKEQSGQQQVESFGRDPEYLKHGNHGLGYAFVPPISPYENPLPLNEETSTTMASTTTHQPLLQSTTAAAITQVHTSSTSEPKMASLKPLYTPTMPPVKAVTNRLADHTTTTTTTSTRVSTPLISTVTAKLADSTTTENSLPVTATEPPIVSFGRQSAAPVEFPTVKFTLPTSYYLPSSSKEKLQQSLLSYLLSQQSKDSVKGTAIVPTSHELSDTLNNSLNDKLQGAVLNYVEESKDALKSTLQNSLLNYLLQQQSNHGSTFQQPSPFEATNHVPLTSIVDRPKMALPSIPIATLSPVSRPLQAINYIPISMPKVSPFAAQDSSPGLQLDINSFPRIDKLQDASSPSSLTSSVFNSLPGGINGGISGSISEGVSTGVPTLNLGQNFQYLGQMRPFEPARSQSYSTGLQLQLGGFGGMDYALRSTNPAPRSTNLGITKLGLSLPEFPRFLRPTIPASYVL